MAANSPFLINVILWRQMRNHIPHESIYIYCDIIGNRITSKSCFDRKSQRIIRKCVCDLIML